MIRNIILDWSGTLVNDLPAVWQATNRLMDDFGGPQFTLEEFRASFCLPFTRFYERILPDASIGELEKSFYRRFAEVAHEVEPLPHAKSFLEFLRRESIRVFLLTAVPESHYLEQCRRNGFDEFIEAAYLGVVDKRAKIEEMLATHGLEARATLFVGDMQHDIETARHGGIFSCAVLTGYNRLDQLRASYPDLIVENLAELQSHLDRSQFAFPPSVEGDGKRMGMPIPTVGALIYNARGEVLMIQTHKWSDLWGIPGGKIRYAEPSEDALRREIQEETGLEVDGIRFAMVQDCIESTEFYRQTHFLLLNYTCHSLGDNAVKLNDEAQTYQWVVPEMAFKLSLNTPTRTLLEHVHSES